MTASNGGHFSSGAPPDAPANDANPSSCGAPEPSPAGAAVGEGGQSQPVRRSADVQIGGVTAVYQVAGMTCGHCEGAVSGEIS
ncbi:hypothetical protein AB0M96_35295, partial [Streptomyces sp. NPDC051098]